jgi:CRISPR-associated helicase Cas3/CRISPR-associated endonuclease Cas3-HD
LFKSGKNGNEENKNMAFYAHSKNSVGHYHPLAEHLRSVGDLAQTYAQACPWPDEARLAGLLHDLGKYGERFQARLRGEDQGLDHWSQGAWLALSEYRALAAGLAIQGHHIGLQYLSPDSLRGMDLKKLLERHPLQLALSHKDLPELKTRMQADGILPTKPAQTVLGVDPSSSLNRMLDVRMLFSALVDADFLDTEAHFQGDENGKAYRKPGPELQAEKALAVLLQEIGRLAERTEAVETVVQVRQALRGDCLNAADAAPGLFTLTAPTGSGKTLAMLAFALSHAQKQGLRRVVMVIPYLSIIEQTARIYREIFDPEIFGKDYVLEHHSLAGRGSENRQADDEGDIESVEAAERRRRLLAENWDAPLIVTTSVQALESLFSNRPSACRKLHRLARSVILFDEAQTLPPGLAVPTLATLSHLAQAYGSSVVFSTATQPAFEHLHKDVGKHSPQGWNPRPIVPEPARLFAPLRRVKVCWPEPGQVIAWPELAEKLREAGQGLCIVNMKKHAKALWEALTDEAPVGAGFSPRKSELEDCTFGEEDRFHLSTNLCSAHRRDVLDAVRARLKGKQAVQLVATQCIEAGVDVDFPLVFRAMAPLDAIIQAAGRCNREGKLALGETHVFMPDSPPEERLYPAESYQQAAAVTQSLLLKHGPTGMALDDPAFIDAYYRELYDIGKPEQSKKTRQIEDRIKAGAFPEIAREYRLIDQDTINVVVPYAPCLELFGELQERAGKEGLTAEWIKSARPLAVSLYRPKQDDPVWDSLLPVQSKRQHGKKSLEDWFIAARPEHYHSALGYQPPKGFNLWIG